MSFGWSAGDIVSAISVITRVSKGLKDSGGAASSYQQDVDFLDSVETTLNGLSTIMSNNAQLTWEDALNSQATRLRDAIEAFVAKARKFEKSLGEGSQRSKIKQAPRKIQWTLFTDEVEKLKVDIERTMSVMNDLIILQNLDSVLEMSKKNDLSFDELKGLSTGISQILPNVEESISALDEQISQGFETLETGQDKLESSFKTDMQDLKACIAELGTLKDFVDREDEKQEKTCGQWQKELERATVAVQKATQVHLELQMQNLRLELRTIVSEELSKSKTVGQSPYFTSTSAFNLLGSGVAGAVGAMLGLSTQAKTPAFEGKSIPVQLAPTFECKECKRVFHNDFTLELSQQTHYHRFECDQCQKTFGREPDLKRHKINHIEKPYWCVSCKKGFLRRNEWQAHIEAREECKKIYERCRTVGTLARHFAEASKSRPETKNESPGQEERSNKVQMRSTPDEESIQLNGGIEDVKDTGETWETIWGDISSSLECHMNRMTVADDEP